MSVSPDDPDFLKNLLGPNTMNSPLMGLAMGLLQAGGPSRMPVSFGQALGQGLQTGQQFQSAGIKNAMQNIELQKQKTQLGFLNGMNNTTQGTGDPNDPTSDPTYQHYLKGAMAGIPGMAEAAQNQLATLRAKERPASPDEVKNFFPQGVPSGQSVVIDGYGNPKVIGDSALATVSVMTPSGTMATVPYNKLTNKLNDVGGVLTTPDYTQPLKDKTQEMAAQDIAAGRRAPPTVSSRNPGAAQQLARADAILQAQGQQGYDASAWPAKQKAAIYWNTGQGATQITAFNAAESHLETLKPLIDNLGNTQSPAFNHLKNYFKYQTGSTAPTDFAAAKQYVGGELAKVVSGAGGTVTEGDRMQAQSQLNNANTPEQLKSAVETIQKLIGGKVLALKTQYTNNGLGNFEHRLEGPARNAMQNFESEQGTQSQAPAASTSNNVKTMSNADLLKALGAPGG